jgi:hypothetical protein
MVPTCRRRPMAFRRSCHWSPLQLYGKAKPRYSSGPADAAPGPRRCGLPAVDDRARGRRLDRLMEQAIELAGGHRSARHAPREQPALCRWQTRIMARRALLQPSAQQTEHLGRQHDVAVLAPLGLHDADDLLGAVDGAREPFRFGATASRRLVSSVLITSGIFCGARMW